jgi:CubicO group peptidase (beta-lactamase class C family)
MRERLQALADRDIERWPRMPGRLIHVLAPNGDRRRGRGRRRRPGQRRTARAGVAVPDRQRDEALRGRRGTPVGRDRRVDLDASLDVLLADETTEILRGGGYDTATITLRQLMTHTSGIYDFAASAYDPSIDDGFDAAIAADPAHRWTREEQLHFAVDHGEPYGPPGTVYCYSDTNANLVGELLERETGSTMGAAIRDLVGYERLGMRLTYQESIEPEPAEKPPWSHQYEREIDVLTIDPSVDLYGGGGLVSTCGDLARFFRALLRGEVFDDPATLATMTTRLQDVPASDAWRRVTIRRRSDVPVPCLGR